MLVSGTGSEHALRFGGGGAAAVASSCPASRDSSASRGSDSDAGASDTIGHDDLAYHRGRTHRLQRTVGELTPERWQPPTTLRRIGACFVCFERVQGAGAAGDAGFAGAAVTRRRLLAG
jgi:hypothetical protein